MELREAVRQRRMVRSFTTDPLPSGLLDELIDLARRSPTAGYAQGVDFLVLEGPEQTSTYWDVALPPDRRDDFPWPGLLDAPALVLPMRDVDAYLARYSEPDKANAGLGADPGAWPVPYWDIDAGMAAMTLLLGAVDAGLGALFFGVFRDEDRLLAQLGVPPGVRPIGTIALGHPAPDDRPSGSGAQRPRRPLDQVIHRGHW